MRTFRFAVKQTVPLLFSYVFVGLAFGVLLNQAGYSPVWALFASALIYAGSMQIVMISMLTAGMPLYTVAIMTFFINGRHMFYGIGFVDRFRKIGGWKYPYMSLLLTDETYSLLCSMRCPEDMDEGELHFDILCFCHLLWIFTSTIGAWIGALLPIDMTGIEFSATGFFVVVVVNQWRAASSRIPVISGFISAIVFYCLLGPNNFILPALSTSMIVLLLMRARILSQTGGAQHE